MALADDLLLYVIGIKSSDINIKLQKLFQNMQNNFHTWNLIMKTSKYESFLFRLKLKNAY